MVESCYKKVSTEEVKMKITKEKKKKLLAKYHRNESRNYHTENAIMLIDVFGTLSEKAKARRLKRKINKRGYVTHEESQWFYNHGHIHYQKLLK